MTPIETASAEETDVQAVVAELRREQLDRSGTVGEYVKGLKEVARETPEQGEVADRLQALSGDQRSAVANELQRQAGEAEEATAGNQDLQIDHSLAGSGEQGNARVGGGRGTINVNPDAVDRVVEEGKGNSFKNLAAHENAHAAEQKPMGDIQLADDSVSAWELYENDSERKGAAAEGKGGSFRRAGQPDDYAAAQDKGDQLRTLGINDGELAEFVGNGDTEGLQKRVIEAEMGRNILTPEKIGENISKGREKYARAAAEVLFTTPA